MANVNRVWAGVGLHDAEVMLSGPGPLDAFHPHLCSPLACIWPLHEYKCLFRLRYQLESILDMWVTPLMWVKFSCRGNGLIISVAQVQEHLFTLECLEPGKSVCSAQSLLALGDLIFVLKEHFPSLLIPSNF